MSGLVHLATAMEELVQVLRAEHDRAAADVEPCDVHPDDREAYDVRARGGDD